MYLELVKTKGARFFQDNDKQHVTMVTRSRLLQLDCKVFTHFPYSPNFVLLNYHLLWFLKNSLNEKNNSFQFLEKLQKAH